MMEVLVELIKFCTSEEPENITAFECRIDRMIDDARDKTVSEDMPKYVDDFTKWGE